MLRNNEAQFYTDRAENARIEGDQLILEARKEPWQGSQFTAASLWSKTLWTYGKIEVRAALPQGRGTWPAIWMLPESISKGVPWPDCGEIDIMENVGYDLPTVHASIHTKSYNHMIGTQKTSTIALPDPTAMHVYGLEWDADKIVGYVDGQRYFVFWNEHKTDKEWPFDQPFGVKLNFAVGGMWGGNKGIDESVWPQRFAIDWVRVYQQAK